MIETTRKCTFCHSWVLGSSIDWKMRKKIARNREIFLKTYKSGALCRTTSMNGHKEVVMSPLKINGIIDMESKKTRQNKNYTNSSIIYFTYILSSLSEFSLHPCWIFNICIRWTASTIIVGWHSDFVYSRNYSVPEEK